MSSLPSGTVTFLFTDIEGTARMWEALIEEGKAMWGQEAHDNALRALREVRSVLETAD